MLYQLSCHLGDTAVVNRGKTKQLERLKPGDVNFRGADNTARFRRAPINCHGVSECALFFNALQNQINNRIKLISKFHTFCILNRIKTLNI